jgi:hypothetical protein
MIEIYKVEPKKTATLKFADHAPRPPHAGFRRETVVRGGRLIDIVEVSPESARSKRPIRRRPLPKIHGGGLIIGSFELTCAGIADAQPSLPAIALHPRSDSGLTCASASDRHAIGEPRPLVQRHPRVASSPPEYRQLVKPSGDPVRHFDLVLRVAKFNLRYQRCGSRKQSTPVLVPIGYTVAPW